MPQTYGKSLPDQYERIASLIGTHLEVVSDVREFYRDRVALEREYASKLQILAKRAGREKGQSRGVFSLLPCRLHKSDKCCSTLNLAYDEIINSTIKTAQDHVNLAEVLTSQTVSDLKTLETRKAETKKKRMLFFQRLLSDKDRTNVERQKAKTKYDEECAEVEAYRHKQGRSHDDRHADRIARQSEQQRNDMLNSKNLYLISTAVANATKDKFYSEDLPALEDEFQMIQTRLVKRFSKILLHAQALQMSHMDTLKSRLANVERCLNDIDPAKDQDIFIDSTLARRFMTRQVNSETKMDSKLNIRQGAISVEPAPKIFLQNKLSKCQSKLGELEPLIANKRRESDQLANLVSAYTEDPSLGNLDQVSDSYFDTRHQLTLFTTSENILKTEIATVLDALGDDIGEQQPHSFKSSSFSIPTTCGYCKTSIWGLSKQGKTCKACGLSVHSKCELKVPADCQTGSQSSLKPVGSRLSTLATPNKPTPTASSFVQSVPEQEVDYPIARILFQFAATSEFELSISEGDSVRVLEPDDGSGWVKVLDHQGQDGLVPASYLAYEEDPPVGGEQDSGHHVRALYTYEARGSDEIDLAEGDMIELSSGPNGGRNYGDSWWEGTNPRGEKGIFPSNYVQAV
ncbi:hypothetical protein C8J56DRAFT_1074375 [Mycena floridula]|nr:hypothetical protein C8J56DRAFT_1074375 [Mycena floridula]